MFSILRRIQRPVAFVSCLMLSGCVAMDPAMMAGLPGDILAGRSAIQDLGSKPTSIYDVQRKVRGAAFLIATVQKYAILTTMQKREVEQVVTRKYNGYVSQEKRKLAPQYAQKKSEVQKRGAAKVTVTKRTNPDAAAKVEAETKREAERVDLEWDKAAKGSVAKNYGTDFAVPVENPDGKAVVAFASVKDSGVSVSDSSYEVAGAASTLTSSKSVEHSGKTYAVLDAEISR